MDEAKLHQFVGQMLNDLGGAVSVALVRMGDALGLYKSLHQNGPMTVKELAAAVGVNERYLREWASHHAASNYLSYDPATQKFTLPPEQAMVFAIDDSPVNMIGAFDSMVAVTGNQDKVQPAFKHGGGSPGATNRRACSVPSRGSSVPAIRTISSASGFRHWRGSLPSSNAVPASPTSGAATEYPRC